MREEREKARERDRRESERGERRERKRESEFGSANPISCFNYCGRNKKISTRSKLGRSNAIYLAFSFWGFQGCSVAQYDNAFFTLM